jgi:hypothetical protein
MSQCREGEAQTTKPKTKTNKIMKNQIQVHDEKSLFIETPIEGRVYAYAPKNGNDFFFTSEDSLSGVFKCSFTEDFEDYWNSSDLESDEIF